jgi:hypothetical protein
LAPGDRIEMIPVAATMARPGEFHRFKTALNFL